MTSSYNRSRGFVLQEYLLAALAGLLGTAMALLATARYGIGLTPDSAAYLSAASSLAAGHGFTMFGGVIFAAWAPGFPMLLALVELGRPASPAEIARFVNAAAFGLLVAASVCWLRRQKVARGFLIGGAAAALLSPPVFKQSIVALSDMLFALFTLLFLAAMGEFLVSGRRREFALAAIFAAVACLARYSAPAVILTGCLLLLAQPGKSLRGRVGQALLFAVVSGAGIAAWLARNYILTSTLTGPPRPPSADSLGDNIRLTLNTITSWVLPSRAPFWPRLIVVGTVIVAAAVLLMLRRRGALQAARSSPKLLRSLAFGVYGLVYIVFLILASTQFALEQIGDRFLSPVYMPLILLAIIALDALLAITTVPLSKIALGALCGLWLLYPAWASASTARYAINTGSGSYPGARWQDSLLVAYLRGHALDGPIYTNDPEAVYLLTGLATHGSPGKHGYRAPDSPGANLAQFAEALPPVSYLAWFAGRGQDWLYFPEELRSAVDLAPVAEFADGTIYRMQALHR